MKIVIAYGSTTGNTQAAAEAVRQALGGDLIDVAAPDAEAIRTAELLVLGTSTWGFGELQDDWAAFLPTLEGMNWTGKKVALFGQGDQTSWGDTFVDGMGILHETAVKLGAEVVGKVSREGYACNASRALAGDWFAGLPLDENNQPEQTADRIERWTQELKRTLGIN